MVADITFDSSGADRDVLTAMMSHNGAAIVGRRMYDVVDEISLHIAPVLTGAGRRLFDHIGDTVRRLEIASVTESSLATHVRYRIRSA